METQLVDAYLDPMLQNRYKDFFLLVLVLFAKLNLRGKYHDGAELGNVIEKYFFIWNI